MKLPHSMADRIAALVGERREALVRTLCDLIRINTVNPYAGGNTVGSEKPGQDYLEPRLRAIGLKTRRAQVRADVYQAAGILGPEERSFEERPNLIAEIEFKEPGPHLLLFAHMDTVGVDEMSIPPFEPTRDAGRIFGRGSSDDKSGITVGFHAIETLLALGLPLRGRLSFASVVDEECNGGGSGIMSLCLDGLQPDAAICLDGPASAIFRGCNGVVTGRIQVPGISAHAASPDGISALEKALLIRERLEAFRTGRAQSKPAGLFNLGVLRAGSHPAMVPGSAELLFNLAYLPDEAAEARTAGLGYNGSRLRQELEQIVAGAGAADPFLAKHPARLSWIKDLPPYVTPAGSRLLGLLEETCRSAGVALPPVKIAPFWTDAAVFSALTSREVINLGSGAGTAHAPDEYAEEETLLGNVRLLAGFMARFLGGS